MSSSDLGVAAEAAGQPEGDWGCEYCRNDGRLVENVCPKCDADYSEGYRESGA